MCGNSLYTVGMDQKTTPTETELLSVRGLPTWAADAIRARADKYGQSYAAVVRIILTDWAMRETAQPNQPRRTPATVKA